MLAFEMDFFPRTETRGDDWEEFDGVLVSFLASLLRNGNIGESWQIIERENGVQVRVTTPTPDALERKNWSECAHRDWQKLETLFHRSARFVGIEIERQKQTWCDCESPSGRLLFTTFLDEGSPVQCLDCRRDVPLFRLPAEAASKERNYLRGWQAQYQALDQLWMACDVGERFSYRQLARPKSDFMRQTRQLAAQLETDSGVPTYWFLMNYHRKWGKKCPLCGRKWIWKDSSHEFLARRCEHCRLMSSDAGFAPKKLSQLHP